MCGISGYLSPKYVSGLDKLILEMLERLEYRGYDSAGICVVSDGEARIWKDVGRLSHLKKFIVNEDIVGTAAIGHTRWATHGGVTKFNAHPHHDCDKKIILVHNGIIENFLELRSFLLDRGHKFYSETDTEVIAHLVEEYYKETGDLYEAFKKAMKEIKGSYAIVLVSTLEPNKIFFARYFSPLVLGIGDKGYFVASDVLAFISYTNKAIFLEDGDIGYITLGKIHIENLKVGKKVAREVKQVPWSFEAAKKGGYPHFMLKEIYEGPEAIKAAASTPIDFIRDFNKHITDSDIVYLVAAGTSYHAALVGETLLRNLGFRAQAVISSEFAENIGSLDKNDTIIAISQSGETADTLAAIRYAREFGTKILSITNVVGSAITRLSERVIYMNAGPEIGVAATKTYIAQLTSLNLIHYVLAKDMGLDVDDEIFYLKNKLPGVVGDVIKKYDPYTKEIAKSIKGLSDSIFISDIEHLPTALEGALKLKEISYIHAEGYSIQRFLTNLPYLNTENYALVFVGDKSSELIDSIRGRLGKSTIITISSKGTGSQGHFEISIGKDIPRPQQYIAYIPPLQLLAYHTSVLRGYDPDKPRNLAKSVTVE